MTSGPQQETDGPWPAGQAFPLVLELSLADGDPVSGTVGVAGGPPAIPFHGWIDLMSAVNSLRVTRERPLPVSTLALALLMAGFTVRRVLAPPVPRGPISRAGDTVRGQDQAV